MKIYKTFLIALLIIVADQISKFWVMDMLWPDGVDGFQSREILPFFNLVTVWNKGVSFGMLRNDHDFGPILLIILSLVIAGGFAVWAFRTKDKIHHLCTGLIIGGAIGNVIDRILHRAVFDFLDFHAFGFHWPAFNIADSSICVGVFILMFYSLLFEKNLQSAT